jgi:hypothetical protein
MDYENDEAAVDDMAAEDEIDTEIAEIQERLGCDWESAWHICFGIWDEDDYRSGYTRCHSGARNS